MHGYMNRLDEDENLLTTKNCVTLYASGYKSYSKMISYKTL